MNYKILKGTLGQIVKSDLAKGLGIDRYKRITTAGLRPPSDYFHLLAANQEPDLIDTALSIPYSSHPGESSEKFLRGVYELIENTKNIIIGDVHTHASQPKPSENDLIRLRHLEDKYNKPFYGLIAGHLWGYTFPLALSRLTKNGIKYVEAKARGPPLDEKLLQTAFRLEDYRKHFVHTGKLDREGLLERLLSEYMADIQNHLFMHDSGGSEIPLEII